MLLMCFVDYFIDPIALFILNFKINNVNDQDKINDQNIVILFSMSGMFVSVLFHLSFVICMWAMVR